MKGLALAKQAYDSLTEAANADIIKQWSAEEEDAQARWAEDLLSMDLFYVHLKQVGPSRVQFKYVTCSNIPYMTQAPARQTCSYDWYKMLWHQAVREVLPPGWALV